MKARYTIGQAVTPREDWHDTHKAALSTMAPVSDATRILGAGAVYTIVATDESFAPSWQGIAVRDNRGNVQWFTSKHFRSAKRIVKAQRKLAQQPWHGAAHNRGAQMQALTWAAMCYREALKPGALVPKGIAQAKYWIDTAREMRADHRNVITLP